MPLTPPPVPQRMGVDFPRFLRSLFCRVVTWVVIVALLLTDLPLSLAPPQSWAAAVAFGPEDFVRGTGKPQAVVRTFAVANPTGPWTLCIANGGQHNQYGRVSSAVVMLNKITVVGPSAFNQTVAQISQAVTLQAINVLSVELRSAPGSGLTLTIVQGTHCQNTLPVANAGADQTVFVTQAVQLDGSGSSDADGDLLQFHWSFVSMPPNSTAALSDPTAVKPTFVVDRPGQYVLQLIVNDGQVDSAADQVTISTQNSKPVANAGPDQTVPLGLRVFLDGSKSSDVDGDLLSYHWSLLSQPAGSTATLDNATTVSPSFIPDKAGSYTVQLIVNDGKVDSDPDTVVISTQNSKPVANAGLDQTVQVGNTVQLDGSGSTDADGDPLTYLWSFTSKPDASSAAFSDPAVQKPTFIADKVGLYVVQLIVNDGKESSDPDTASITVKVVPPANHPPVANAGADQNVSVGTTVHLDGGQSSDPDGDTLSFSWQFSLKPASSQAVLQNADTATPSFVADVAGPYSVQLTVSDGRGGSASDIVDITVTTTSNQPPVITSTPVTTATVGQPYTYDVDTTDPDVGDTLTFSLDVAPAGMTIDPTTGLIQWTPTAGQVGDNSVTVRVQDSGGLFATQSFTVTVTPAGANHPPEITSTPTVSHWTQLTPTGTPPTPRWGSSANAYDEINDRLILFGGLEADNTHLADVWVLANASGAAGAPTWIHLSPTGTPPSPRFAAGIIYDSTANRLLVHGGCPGNCGSESGVGTWILTNANGLGGTPEWISLPAGSVRAGQAVGYDPVSNRKIEFSGLNGGPGSDTNDVWVFTDANGIGDPAWLALSPLGDLPPPRGEFASGAYDPIANRFIVFGGLTTLNGQFNDVWVLSNADGVGGTPQWTQLFPTGDAPTPRGDQAEIYDANSNRLIVFGGLDTSPFPAQPYFAFNETWVLTYANGNGGASEWIKLTTPGEIPLGRAFSSVGYARSTNRLVVAMGRNDRSDPGTFNDVWVLFNANGQCTAGQPCNYDVDAIDPDAGDTLTFSLDTAPAGMTIDATTGLIEWIPTPDQISDHNVVVRVRDSGGLFVTQSFTLTVAPVAVPNVVGLDPASAEALIGAADLTVGTETHVGGDITLHFDTLPSAQGWTYKNSTASNPDPGVTTPEVQVFSIAGNALHQDSFGLNTPAYYSLRDAIDVRLPFTLSLRARVTEDLGDPSRNPVGFAFEVWTGQELFGIGLSTGLISDDDHRTVGFDNRGFHDYVLQGGTGQGYRLLVDGSEQLMGGGSFLGPTDRLKLFLLGQAAGGQPNARADVTSFDFIQPRVTSQNLPAGTLVPNKSVVDLTVQDGPATVTVPNVVGLTQADATAAIVAANLSVGTITTANSNTVPAGQVISQAPVAGTNVSPNTAVNFVVSLGPASGNLPPTITSTPVTAATVGQVYTYGVTATDPDAGDVLTFSLPTAPAGMTIDPTTGLIQWTPTPAQVGDQSVTVRVQDAGGLFATQSFTVTVAPGVTNHPPAITSTPVIVATVGQPYSYAVGATDPDAGDVLTFSLPTAPTGMTIDTATGLIQWTPTAAQVGDSNVTARVQDSGGLFATQSFTVTVTPVGANHPPEITSTPSTAHWIQLTPTGTPPTPRAEAGAMPYDVVNDRLILFSGENNFNALPRTPDVWVLTSASGTKGPPTWIQLSPTGTAPVGRVEHSVVYDPTGNRLIIHGGCQGNCLPILGDTWVLTNANGLGGDPEWIQLPSSNTRSGHVAGYDLVSNRMVVFGGHTTGFTGGDANDVEILTDANGIGNPTWISLAPVGAPPVPRGEVASGVYDPLSNRLIIFGGFTTTQQTFNDVWVLSNANGLGGTPEWTQLAPSGTPPAPRGEHSVIYDPNSNRLTVFGGLTPDPGNPYFFFNDTWVLTHANGTGGTPEWIPLASAGDLPLGRGFHSVGYAGASNRMIVSLGRNDRAPSPGTFNDAWVLTNASGQCTAGQLCDYDVEATDPDAGDVLTFSLDAAPAGMTIDPATGLMEWTPTPAQIGDHNVTVRVRDAGGLFATQSFTLTVAPVAVPNVVGLDPTSAEALIGAADLTVGTETHVGGDITLSFGTLPSAQGWTYFVLNNPATETEVFSVSGGTLFQNSLSTGFQGQGSNRYNFFTDISPRLPFTLAVRARVLEENGDINTNSFGFFFNSFTKTKTIQVGLGTSKIDDANSGDGRFLSTTIDNTQFHNYRLEGSLGIGYRLFIDDVLLATGPTTQTSNDQSRSFLSLGDGTGGTNL